MQNFNCPRCGAPNRSTARFCGKCGMTFQIAASTPGAPAYSPPAQPAYSPSPQLAPTAVAQMPAAQPMARQAGAAVASGAGRILRSIARVLTLGGRAAYADLVAPQVVASGLVVSPPSSIQVASNFEVGFFMWIAAWLLGALLLMASGLAGASAFVFLYLILFALSWLGLRQPYFSRLTLSTLLRLVTGKGRGSQPAMHFTLNTAQHGQVLVTMLGPIDGLTAQTMPQVQHAVQLWGIKTGQVLRAWKLEFLGTDYRPVGTWLSTPRVLPLTAALFIPLTFWLIVWLAFVR